MSAEDFLYKNWAGEIPVNIEKLAQRAGLEVDYGSFRPNVLGITHRSRVVINRAIPLSEQRFLIAHAIGHHLDGSWDKKSHEEVTHTLNSNTVFKEKTANAIAIGLLVPKQSLKYVMKEKNLRSCDEISKFFSVNSFVALNALKAAR